MVVERGTAGRLPYLAVGSGPPLVYLAGLLPATGVDRRWLERTARATIAPFAHGRRVLFVNRRPGLARGTTMADLAAEHADAIRSSLGTAVDVLGDSTGGSIAQQLAADHPDVVRRLVLVRAACRLGPAGRREQRRIAARIRRGARRRAFAVMTSSLVSRRRGQVLAGAAAWLAAPWLAPDADELADLATTIEAEDAFDLARCRATVRAPTLIVAGGRDGFYSPELFAETARLIPSSRLLLLPGRGHVNLTGAPEYVPAVERFLAEG